MQTAIWLQRCRFFIGRELTMLFPWKVLSEIKEISYIHSEAYAGELKHEPFLRLKKGLLGLVSGALLRKICIKRWSAIWKKCVHVGRSLWQWQRREIPMGESGSDYVIYSETNRYFANSFGNHSINCLIMYLSEEDAMWISRETGKISNCRIVFQSFCNKHSFINKLLLDYYHQRKMKESWQWIMNIITEIMKKKRGTGKNRNRRYRNG